MTSTLPLPVVKEIRALLPTFVAILIAVIAGSRIDNGPHPAVAWLIFGLGSIALGAQSFGHEYGNRTLGLLLIQPIARTRLFACKLVVLATMLGTLGVAAFGLLERPPQSESQLLILATVCGVSLAPWLTLLCRSAIAAVVFTIGIPGVLALATDTAGAVIYGTTNAKAIDQLRELVFWPGMSLICLSTAIASWRMFQRLELAGDVREEIQLADALSPLDQVQAATVRRSRVALLVLKELRLQQMSVVIAALYVPTTLALAWLDPATTISSANLPVSLSTLYAGVLALVIGSVSVAEERRLGMLDWQLLVPLRAAWQWLIKVAVAFSLLFALGVFVPWALVVLIGARYDLNQVTGTLLLAALLSLLAASLYLSTLCRSGIAALVLSLPVVMASWMWVITVSTATVRYLYDPLRLIRRGSGPFPPVVMVVTVGLIGLLLVLGARNHRSTDSSYRRIAVQALLITAYLTAAVIVASWSRFR